MLYAVPDGLEAESGVRAAAGVGSRGCDSLPAVPQPAPDLLTSLLRDVSRSFYLTLRVLPRGLRRPISLAYLLARATDTVADTGLVPVTRRLEALDALREAIRGRAGPPDWPDLVDAQSGQASVGEQILLQRIPEALACLEAEPEPDRGHIRSVLETITSGQELDLQRFEPVAPGGVRALPDAASLDDYTYRVAGCVGEFWTRICRAHLPSLGDRDEERMLEDGIRFGQGLQLVNILRDLPRDLRNGRCYLPADELAAAGLKPGDLVDPGMAGRLRPVHGRWCGRAREHLAAGWRYTVALGPGHRRLRLACAWPVLIGLRTLDRLAEAPLLDPDHRVKVPRSEVRAILWSTLWRLPFPTPWNRLGLPR